MIETILKGPEGGGPYRMPKSILEGIFAHVEHGQNVGGFLTAVLSNDLTEAVCRADEESLTCIRDIVKYVYNETPGPCHGSEEAVKAWRRRKEEQALEPAVQHAG